MIKMQNTCHTFVILLANTLFYLLQTVIYLYFFLATKKKKNEFVKFKNVKKHLQLQFLEI